MGSQKKIMGGLCKYCKDHLFLFVDVSIHAPARGATEFNEEVTYDKPVSIHAPARGATVLVICQGKSNSYLGVFENCPKRSSLKNHS